MQKSTQRKNWDLKLRQDQGQCHRKLHCSLAARGKTGKYWSWRTHPVKIWESWGHWGMGSALGKLPRWFWYSAFPNILPLLTHTHSKKRKNFLHVWEETGRCFSLALMFLFLSSSLSESNEKMSSVRISKKNSSCSYGFICNTLL